MAPPLYGFSLELDNGYGDYVDTTKLDGFMNIGNNTATAKHLVKQKVEGIIGEDLYLIGERFENLEGITPRLKFIANNRSSPKVIVCNNIEFRDDYYIDDDGEIQNEKYTHGTYYDDTMLNSGGMEKSCRFAKFDEITNQMEIDHAKNLIRRKFAQEETELKAL
ncbi:MAG: hypothetical protein FWE31_01835 [Firmicutes bacterium]|nr:hypothetical protein [Bacillota bacterium]